jgi:uncharacterized membrane protein YozB (DUF420 family)
LLIVGLLLIRSGRELAHRRVMLTSFAVSIAFLVCYVTYHYGYGHTIFNRQQYPRAAIVYYVLLATHVPLAALVPILAMATIFLGLTNRRTWHRKWARWTFPMWVYVSISGILVYLMIYWWFPTLPVLDPTVD